MKINSLVVDDDEICRKIITHRLQENPIIDVIGDSNSYEEVIENITKFRPSVIFLDVHLWDGKTAYDLLQRIEYQPKVVIVSGYNDFIFDALKLGAIAFLSKPFTKDEIHTVAEKIVSQLKH
jgi:response regulator of citrate/malate metabolism